MGSDGGANHASDHHGEGNGDGTWERSLAGERPSRQRGDEYRDEADRKVERNRSTKP